MSLLDNFSETYAESRQKFHTALESVHLFWPEAEIKSTVLEPPADDLAVEVISAPARKRKEKAIILNAALHGIEGYTGSAVNGMFCSEFLQFLNPDQTGLSIVHALNPWGMLNRRCANENTVDLNRNFVYNRQTLDLNFNRLYDRIDPFLNRPAPVDTNSLAFLIALVSQLLSLGVKGFKEAMLIGQYRFPGGLFYGGQGFEQSARIMISLFNELAASYSQILLLDMHTGYGPRYQMSIVNSNQEPRSSPELARAFNYQAVSKTNPDEFYAIRGDMIDYFYSLVEDHYPGLRLYAAAFEFGTLGESLPAQIRSIKALVNEKRLHHYGAVSARAEKKARHDYNEQYYPAEARWRETVLKDTRQAFEGILQSEGFIEKT